MTVVFILLGIGLSVDYSGHIVHAFYSDENAVEGEEETKFSLFDLGHKVNHAVLLRMERALFAVGPNTFLAKSIAIMGVMVLGWSSSPVYRMFYNILAVLLNVSMVHALVFVPALCTFLPPAQNPHK